MKTISRITFLLGLLITLSTGSFSQSPLVELQTLETTLGADIASTQASITNQQNLLTTVLADINAFTETGELDEAQALTERQTELNASVAALQATLSALQADLAIVQGKITSTQNELNQLDKNWVMANTPPAPPAPADPRILAVPDPNNPSTLNIIFGSTGNAQQDEQILRAWLYQYGLIDAE